MIQENELLLSRFAHQSQRAIRKKRKQFFVGDELYVPAPGVWSGDDRRRWIGGNGQPPGNFGRAARQDGNGKEQWHRYQRADSHDSPAPLLLPHDFESLFKGSLAEICQFISGKDFFEQVVLFGRFHGERSLLSTRSRR